MLLSTKELTNLLHPST